MAQFFIQPEILKKFRTHFVISGILLIITGTIGIVLPALMSLSVSMFVGWMLIIGGLISVYHVIKSYHKKWLAWLKPFILFVTGILLLLYPLSGVAALSLLLAIYFLMDAFAGFSFAFELHPFKGWGWMLFNGIISLILAIIFLIGWPLNDLWLVGLFIGISLFMDGLVLLIMGISAG